MMGTCPACGRAHGLYPNGRVMRHLRRVAHAPLRGRDRPVCEGSGQLPASPPTGEEILGGELRPIRHDARRATLMDLVCALDEAVADVEVRRLALHLGGPLERHDLDALARDSATWARHWANWARYGCSRGGDRGEWILNHGRDDSCPRCAPSQGFGQPAAGGTGGPAGPTPPATFPQSLSHEGARRAEP